MKVTEVVFRGPWQPTPVFLPGESHGQWSLVGYSPRGRKDSDMTERLTRSLPLHCVLSIGTKCFTCGNALVS